MILVARNRAEDVECTGVENLTGEFNPHPSTPPRQSSDWLWRPPPKWPVLGM